MHKPKEWREEQQKSEKPPHLPARGWESELRPIPSAPQPPGRAGRGVPEAIARPVALATPPERPASKAAPPCPPARGSPGEKRGDRAAGLRVESVVGTQRGERAATPGRAGFKEPGDAQDGFGGEKPSQGRRRLSDVQIRAKMAPKCSHPACLAQASQGSTALLPSPQRSKPPRSRVAQQAARCWLLFTTGAAMHSPSWHRTVFSPSTTQRGAALAARSGHPPW